MRGKSHITCPNFTPLHSSASIINVVSLSPKSLLFPLYPAEMKNQS